MTDDDAAAQRARAAQAAEAARAEAAQLRQRAATLRHLAGVLDASVLRSLRRLGSDDTWRGPTADAFLDTCASVNGRVDRAVDDLWWSARWLDTEAAYLESTSVGAV
jgi:hypothetical protein